MDSITHVVLGAALGDALLGKKVGKKTMLWGAIMSTVPDLDVFPAMLMSDVNGMHFHRGFFHSLLFFVLSAPLFGWLIQKIYKGRSGTWREWMLFSFFMMCMHSFLDSFTNWGTRIFVPIDYHVAFNTIFILDPVFSLPLLIGFFALVVLKSGSVIRKRINYAAIGLSAAYLLMTIVNKEMVNSAFRESLAKQNIQYERMTTKPTPLNNFLWSAMVEADSGYYLGYYSFFDEDKDVAFQFIPREEQLLIGLPESEELKTLIHTTDRYYCVREENNRLMLHDLRFGQATDFKTGTGGKFVFSFYLDKVIKGDKAELQITQTQFDSDDVTKETFVMLWKRMLGQKQF